MTTTIDPIPTPLSVPAEPRRAKSFVAHAKLIGGLTLVSRVFGLGRDVVAGHYLGDHLVGTAFSVAFQVPNLFRKLFGEGALSAAFIPLYAQQLKAGDDGANAFAAATVNLLVITLAAVTVAGEGVIAGLLWVAGGADHPDRVLMFRLAAVMLPYVLLICGGAFLSGVLQVHKRFGPPAAAPIVLNVVHIAVLLVGARLLHLAGTESDAAVIAKQTRLAGWLAGFVLVAGSLQVAMLLPALRATGFRFRPRVRLWTPLVKRMLLLSVPVAVGAGVLQVSVLLDNGIAFTLMQGVDGHGRLVDSFHLFGHVVRFPMEEGAPTRLARAQSLYQFPLGVFAIALATAIFPGLSADALSQDRDRFRDVLRQGIRASLWEGLPASLGMILVARPAARLLFQHGQIGGHDAGLIARTAMVYGGAIWAFSLLQIVNRAFYALHDMTTPLVMSVVNVGLNLAVELPLLWWLGETGMAVGTLVSFAAQAAVMLWVLDRKVGGLDLGRTLAPVAKMALATAVMGLACGAFMRTPLYPAAQTRPAWAAQVAILLTVGVAAYLGTCAAVGEHTLADLLPRRR